MKTVLCIIICINYNILYSQTAPFDSPFSSQYIKPGFEVLTGRYQYPEAWFVAATLHNTTDPNDGYVKIDYYKFIEIDSYGNKKIVDDNYYDIQQQYLTSAEGGLCSRNPEKGDFCTSMVKDLDNARIDGNYLIVTAGKYSDKISHWWSNRVHGTRGCTYVVEVKFLVHGEIGFQIGCDEYKESEGQGEHVEAWVSNWFSDTNGEFITKTVPIFGINTKFTSGVDYGVTTNGKFFISQQLVEHCGGSNEVQLLSDPTGWRDTPMSFDGQYWFYESGKKLKKNNKVLFCFHLNSTSDGHYIPHIIVSDNTIGDINDVVQNNSGGYNFNLFPSNE